MSLPSLSSGTREPSIQSISSLTHPTKLHNSTPSKSTPTTTAFYSILPSLPSTAFQLHSPAFTLLKTQIHETGSLKRCDRLAETALAVAIIDWFDCPRKIESIYFYTHTFLVVAMEGIYEFDIAMKRIRLRGLEGELVAGSWLRADEEESDGDNEESDEEEKREFEERLRKGRW